MRGVRVMGEEGVCGIPPARFRGSAPLGAWDEAPVNLHIGVSVYVHSHSHGICVGKSETGMYITDANL